MTCHLNQFVYLDGHFLYIYIKLSNLLHPGHPNMVFSDKSIFHKVLTHIFTLHLDTLQYLALHDLINIIQSADNFFCM